jgi:hypothetical protein
MAPSQSELTRLTIHPWLDQPIYNRIRYSQWKLYLYNAAQKMCSSMDPTGAYFLVALDADWNLPKESSARYPCYKQRGSSARIHSAAPNLHHAHHIWFPVYRLQ